MKIFGMTREDVNVRYGQLALNVRTSGEYSDADYFEMQMLIAVRQCQDALDQLENAAPNEQGALLEFVNAARDAEHYFTSMAKALYR